MRFIHPDKGFEQTWITILQNGGIFKDKKQPSDVTLAGNYVITSPGRAVFAGEKNKFPFHLQLFPSPILYDGRSEHFPWLQETRTP